MRPIKFRAWDGNRMFYTFIGEPQYEFYSKHLVIPVAYTGDDENEYQLMQFTALLDRNGKEIYEGDVLKTKHGRGQVIWHGFSASFAVALDNKEKPLLLVESDQEVVGNIYENPELVGQSSP